MVIKEIESCICAETITHIAIKHLKSKHYVVSFKIIQSNGHEKAVYNNNAI